MGRGSQPRSRSTSSAGGESPPPSSFPPRNSRRLRFRRPPTQDRQKVEADLALGQVRVGHRVDDLATRGRGRHVEIRHAAHLAARDDDVRNDLDSRVEDVDRRDAVVPAARSPIERHRESRRQVEDVERVRVGGREVARGRLVVDEFLEAPAPGCAEGGVGDRGVRRIADAVRERGRPLSDARAAGRAIPGANAVPPGALGERRAEEHRGWADRGSDVGGLVPGRGHDFDGAEERAGRSRRADRGAVGKLRQRGVRSGGTGVE